MRSNYEIVLRALQNGAEVKLPNGETHTLIDGELCFHLYPDNPDSSWIPCDITFNEFLRQCDQLTETDIYNLAWSNAMASMKNSPANPLKWDK